MILVLLSLLSHFQTNAHTTHQPWIFFPKAACVIQSLFFNTSESFLPLVYHTIISRDDVLASDHIDLSSVLPPLQFNPFT